MTGAWTSPLSCPKPGMSVATPHSTGRTSRISATSESPGSAPRTATGPVALLMRPRSMSVTRSVSLVICPVKQSFVSKVTTSPGSTSRTGSRSGPKAQITWSRVSRCCAMSHTCTVDDDPPICPVCGVTMVPAALSAVGSSGDWVCLECEETGEPVE